METNEILNGTANALIIVRRDDLIEFATVCAHRLQESQAMPTTKKETEQPISQPEAVKFLGKSRQTLTAWRKKGIISAHTLGGRVYYLKSELLEAMK